MLKTNTSAWPAAADVSNALRDTEKAFPRGHQLYKCEVLDKNSFGAPVPAGVGANAYTYKVKDKQGKEWALIFSKVELKDASYRYLKMKSHFRSFGVEGFLDFNYYEPRQGIIVNGVGYPFLLMEWSFGVTLDEFVELNIGSPQRLTQLANRFKVAHTSNVRKGVALGDIHSQDIHIQEDPDISITWLDYYPVWVPDLAYIPTQDVGTPCFVHPDKFRANYYGPNQDAFPARVIYLSLLACAVEPRLFDEYYIEGENILFHEEDFYHVGQTQLWKDLECLNDLKVQFYIENLKFSLSTPVEHIPALIPPYYSNSAA